MVSALCATQVCGGACVATPVLRSLTGDARCAFSRKRVTVVAGRTAYHVDISYYVCPYRVNATAISYWDGLNCLLIMGCIVGRCGTPVSLSRHTKLHAK